jgi:hypothetical protein
MFAVYATHAAPDDPLSRVLAAYGFLFSVPEPGPRSAGHWISGGCRPA